MKRLNRSCVVGRLGIKIIVDEGPVRIEMTGDPANPTRVVRSHRPRLLMLPIVNRQDGYGFTSGSVSRLAAREGSKGPPA